MNTLKDFIRLFAKTRRDPDGKASPQATRIETAMRGTETYSPRSHPDTVIDTLQEAKVIKVLDGDTVSIITSCQKMTVRLACIDSPKEDQPWGNTAKSVLIKLVGARRVRIETHGVDNDGSLLATMFVRKRASSDWINVNEYMVTLGHAWVLRAYYSQLPRHRKAKLHSLEHWARSKKVGLWLTKNPTPPWQWRHDT